MEVLLVIFDLPVQAESQDKGPFRVKQAEHGLLKFELPLYPIGWTYLLHFDRFSEHSVPPCGYFSPAHIANCISKLASATKTIECMLST